MTEPVIHELQSLLLEEKELVLKLILPCLHLGIGNSLCLCLTLLLLLHPIEYGK